MHTPPKILIVDDNEANRDILETRLGMHGYELIQGVDGEEAIALARQHHPDLILLDIMMPKLNGIEVCRQLKSDPDLPYMAIILVTAKAETSDVVTGLEAGADEYVTKPIDQTELVARVKSVLRMKSLYDQVQAQTEELSELNGMLETRVEAQVAEIERMQRLRRFLSPQIVDLVLSKEQERLLDSHRGEVTVVFCDLRGFTAFSETAEPEEVMTVLGEYHRCIGHYINRYDGTLAHFTGDGVMVIFNDPVPCDNPCERAVRMAEGLRADVAELSTQWRRYGHDLGFGVGVAHGYATLGCIGFDERQDYSAIGTVVNLAARLCEVAESGQILIDGKVHAAVETIAEVDPAGELELKGIRRPVSTFELTRLHP